MLPKMEKDKLFKRIYADMLIFVNFCQCKMLPKMEKLDAFRQHWQII